MPAKISKIGWKTAAGLVIANMIGIGVFTSLGYQLVEIKGTVAIVLLWVLGGLMALIGALSYAELGTHFKKSGGDYIFLSQIVHPSVGYLYAWTSLWVGFSAPIAIAAKAMVSYLSPYLDAQTGNFLAIGVIITVSFVHSFSVRQSGFFQNIFTVIKVVFAMGLIGVGFWFLPIDNSALNFSTPLSDEILKPGFAVSLIYVFYAYTGWNAAAYITEEIKKPSKNLPKALVAGTVLVMLLYLLLQIVFLKHASTDQLLGKVEVANISFSNIFGSSGYKWVSLLISLQLVGTISGYAWIGPRVTHAMARDFRNWKILNKTNFKGIPVRALWLNTAISILLMLTGSFEQIMLYAGFVLQLMGTLSVGALLFVKPVAGKFKSPLRPYLQIVYLLFSTWVLAFTFLERPKESMAGFGILLLGLLFYYFDKRQERTR